MASIDKIFSLFDSSGGDKKREEKIKDWKETPMFKLGMFYKSIKNGNLFKNQILNFFKKADDKLNIEEIDTAGEYMVYTRAFFWIESCNIRKKEWKEALENYSSMDFLYAVRFCISYFESIEEYEKCAHLKKIQDFLEKNLIP